MKNVASLFSDKMKEELKKSLGIEITDEYDYSDDEMEELFYQITENFPYEFDSEGNPLEMGQIFEDIIDVFVRNKLPH